MLVTRLVFAFPAFFVLLAVGLIMLRKLEMSIVLRSVARFLLLHRIQKRLSGCLAAKRGDFPQLLQSFLLSGSEHTHFLEMLKFVEVFLGENGCDWSLFWECGEARRWFSVDNALGFDSLAIENVALCYF